MISDNFRFVICDLKPILRRLRLLPSALKSKILCLAWLLLLIAASAIAQAPDVKVRLYSLHSEQRIKITAKTGELAWKSCEQCEMKRASSLTLQLAGDGVKIEGETLTAKRIFVQGDYRIEPNEGLALSIRFPLEVSTEKNALRIFLSLPLEDYVAAALAGESGSFVHDESLKAMAVAVRTYAAHFRQRHASEGFDFCDSTHCQTLNFKGISPQIRAAVQATKGEMLWYAGSPAATFYHQNCGGETAAAQEAWPDLRAPYLKRQQDPYCARTPLPWKTEVGRKELEGALRAQGLTAPATWDALEIIARTPSGRALKLAFRSTSGAVEPVSASSLRFAIGRTLGWNRVRSDLYSIETTAASVIFSGRGAGHGVGLCQAGAEEMANKGKSYRQILAFYYPGTSLGVSAKGFEWQKREGQRLELLSVQPDADAPVLQAAEKILPAVESELGWKLEFKPQLKVYPTLDAFRDSTGQPGWIAAFTRGQIIRLQPLAVLQQKSVLESTLRHEFTHLLIEMRAHAGTPVWFREGMVLYFAEANHNFQPVQMTNVEMENAFAKPQDRQQIERAYSAARTRVAQMVERNGKAMVLRWLTEGLPSELPKLP